MHTDYFLSIIYFNQNRAEFCSIVYSVVFSWNDAVRLPSVVDGITCELLKSS